MQSSYHSFENSKCKYGNTSHCYKTFHVQQKTRYVRRIINSHYSQSQVFHRGFRFRELNVTAHSNSRLYPSRQVLLLLFWNKYLSWSEDLVVVAPAVTKVEGHDVAGVGEHVDVPQVRRYRLDRNADSCLQPVIWSLFSRSGDLF